MAVEYIGRNAPDGMCLGLSSSEKIAFFGGTPASQRSGAVQAAVTTTAATSTSPVGYSTNTQADRIVALLNEIRATLVAHGLIAGA